MSESRIEPYYIEGRAVCEPMSRIELALKLLESIERLEAWRLRYPSAYWVLTSSFLNDNDKRIEGEVECMIHNKPVARAQGEIPHALIELAGNLTTTN